mgnify:FL=1
MLKHIIFWKLSDKSKADEIAADLNMRFKALLGKVDGLKEAEVGKNVNGGDFDLTLYTVFESAEDEKAYQTNPLHLEIKKVVHSVVCDRICIDYLM